MLEVVVVETQKQPIGIQVTQSLDAGITTRRVETIVTLNMDVIKRGILIRSTVKLGSGLGGILVTRNLSRSLALPMANIGVVGTPHMVFTNPITIIHVNKTIDRPLMNSIVVGEYKSVDATNPRSEYQ
jgi:hypothetical protein